MSPVYNSDNSFRGNETTYVFNFEERYVGTFIWMGEEPESLKWKKLDGNKYEITLIDGKYSYDEDFNIVKEDLIVETAILENGSMPITFSNGIEEFLTRK